MELTKNCQQCNTLFQKAHTSSGAYFQKQKYCSMECYGLSKKGKMPWNKGVPQTEEVKSKLSQAHKKTGHRPKIIFRWPKGSPLNPMYIDGRTPEVEKIRKSNKYVQWRNSVFERDNFTCKECGQYGGDLNADHIKPFAFFSELRFELSNGRTLCKSCHLKTDTWGKGSYKYRNMQNQVSPKSEQETNF